MGWQISNLWREPEEKLGWKDDAFTTKPLRQSNTGES